MAADDVCKHLIATNIPGAFTFPAPPDNLDVEIASTETLIKHGLHWCLPHRRHHPALLAARKKVLSRPLLAEDCIVPHLVPQDRRTQFRERLRLTDRDSGPAWAGCVMRGQWDSVEASWVVPYIKWPTVPAGADGKWESKSWVGLDGWGPFGSKEVIQAGVDQSVDSGGNATYVPWFEWFIPAPQAPNAPGCDSNGYPLSWGVGQPTGQYGYIYPLTIPTFTVSPGDTVFCNVSYVENRKAGYIWVRNVTTNKYFGLRLDPPPGAALKGTSVDWIMESPGGGYPGVVLPEWNPPVQFTDCIGTGANGAIANPQNGEQLDIVYPQPANPATTKTLVVLGNMGVSIAWLQS